MIKNVNILIAGGGTGGHLFPAFAIGKRLEKEGANIIYIGSKHGIEKNYKDELKNNLYLLNIKGINRTISMISLINNLLFPIRFGISYLKSIIIIKKINPKIIIGTGGYSSGIPLLVGNCLKIKSVIHEQNSYPGITTRFLSRKAAKVFIAYNNIKKNIPNQNCLLTGNPIRENLNRISKKVACKQIGLNPNKKVIFILGGSQGSKPFNLFFIKQYKDLIKKDIQIIWQTGIIQFKKIYELANCPEVIVKSFIKDIDVSYSCSDIVVSRAGALAIEELKSFNKAMILIPYPNSAGNHQKYNALELVNNNAAKLIEQQDMEEKLIDTINYLLDNQSIRTNMANNAKKLYNSNSLNLIINSIKECIDV